MQRRASSDSWPAAQIDDDRSPPAIRATQGHSVQLDAPVLQRVTSASEVPKALHVTSKASWAKIQEEGYLRRMGRTHIHFATRPDLARKNSWANCFLRLRLVEALADGVEVSVSTNGVVLCEGPLPVKYVEEVSGFSTGA